MAESLPTTAPAGKRLAVFLDGTWNDPTDSTNVWRLKRLVREQATDGTQQLTYYDTGVGTRWYTRIQGGVAAYGLSKNVRQAYRWLVDHYDDGDHIFVFGFSRGSFTARSLIGLIASCGLLRPDAGMSVDQIYERYRRRLDKVPLYRLEKKRERTAEQEWLVLNSRRVPVQFTGIWDTVGTLGIPFGNIPGLSRKKLRFHNTRLSTLFQYGAQALALDEHRKAYNATLWTNYLPVKPDSGEIVDARRAENYFPNFQQRWFVGAHSNIGGGYQQDLLSQVPLRWIQERAEQAGLSFRTQVTLLGQEHLKGKVVDSFKDFARGLYRAVRLGKRFYREVGRDPWQVEGGFVESVNESIDATVFDRWQKDPQYRPENLRRWAEKTDVDLDQILGSQPARASAATGPSSEQG